jgi:hypothetical protein
MPYSQFTTIEQAVAAFQLSIQDSIQVFSDAVPISPSARLKETLDETLDLAASISTEKARSELIITPILLEVRRIFKGQIGYFSGTTFDVDSLLGLNGICDFVLSASNNQTLITAPVLTVVEAKDNDIRLGLGQCAAEMVAAQLFNKRRGQSELPIYGVVSTGTNWKFLKLEEKILFIDRSEYFILQLDKILGILCQPFQSQHGGEGFASK